MKSTNFLKLNNNQKMPIVGLGTWASAPGKVGAAVSYALETVGYKHIDCAKIYGNEPEIGTAFQKTFSAGKIKRPDVFITSKLWNNAHNPNVVEATCRATLKDLQLEYLDLYLMHWGLAFKGGNQPKPKSDDGKMLLENVTIQETWQAMEKLVEKGLVKAIGVANFTTPMITDLLSYAKIRPAVNQIELHPYNAQQPLVDFCQSEGIVVTAYSPLGSPGNAGLNKIKLADDPIIIQISLEHKKTIAQILIRWAIQRQTIVIPKSVTPERIAENFAVFDFELSEAEVTAISALNKNHRYVNPAGDWGIPYFS